jgi:hypothetical protein
LIIASEPGLASVGAEVEGDADGRDKRSVGHLDVTSTDARKLKCLRAQDRHPEAFSAFVDYTPLMAPSRSITDALYQKWVRFRSDYSVETLMRAGASVEAGSSPTRIDATAKSGASRTRSPEQKRRQNTAHVARSCVEDVELAAESGRISKLYIDGDLRDTYNWDGQYPASGKLIFAPTFWGRMAAGRSLRRGLPCYESSSSLGYF